MSTSEFDVTPQDQQPSTALSAVVTGAPTQNYPPSPDQGGPVPQPSTAAPAAPAQPQSRLSAILQAVASVASTALSGVPDKGRPSFATGLGEGARAEQASVANQQAIKFRNFDDQVRLAQLHAQDQKMQMDSQAQQDAHTAAELHMRQMASDMGLDYDTIANHGPTVMDHLTAQTATNGAASVPAGTHVSADGQSIYIPSDPDSQQTRDAQKKLYSDLAPAFGLPSLPPNVQFVPPKSMDMLTNKVNGFGLDGKPVNHQDLPGLIGATQAQRDNLAKNGGTPNQLKALDNVLNIYKTNLDALDSHAATVKQQSKAAELAAETSPENISGQAKLAGAKANAEVPAKIALQNNAAQNKNDSTELNAVAFDPTYKNPDGTLGANVVMAKADAAAKGLTHYKADPSTINTVVAGMNDVQNKLNQLATIANDPNRMAQVDPGLAAAMLAHGSGITLSFGGHGGSSGGGASGGIGIDPSRFNEDLYSHDVMKANQATRDYVAAFVGAHEAITQLPRLQTFGKSNRMTQQQMEAAQNLLPQPGDRDFAAQKMTSLQGMIDPLRKQVPHMPGAEQIPSWLEQQQLKQTQSGGGSTLGRVAMGNPTDLVNRLVPSN